MVGSTPTLPSMIHLKCADIRDNPFPHSRFNLVYVDPPMGMGMNQGVALDFFTPEEFKFFVSQWMKIAVDSLADNSYLVLCSIPKHTQLIRSMVPEYLPLFNEIIWTYNFGLYVRTKFVDAHNNIHIYKKGSPPFNWQAVAIPSQRLESGDPRADLRGRTPGDVWEIPRIPGNDKSREFIQTPNRTCQPYELCERIIKALTTQTSTVFDMFVGSGTMTKVCHAEHRTYFGVDICGEYLQEAERRCYSWNKLK